MINVTVWNEYRHELKDEKVRDVLDSYYTDFSRKRRRMVQGRDGMTGDQHESDGSSTMMRGIPRSLRQTLFYAV